MCLLPPLDLSRRFMYTLLSCLRFLGYRGRWERINQRESGEDCWFRMKGQSSRRI